MLGFIHNPLTVSGVVFAAYRGGASRSERHSHCRYAAAVSARQASMDIVFILIIIALYAVTHWIGWAISRLGGGE